jgi:Ca2+-binding RTX toxin-like protein
MGRILSPLALAIALTWVTAAHASASTVALDIAHYEPIGKGGRQAVYELVFAAAPGETNALVVEPGTNQFRVRDPGSTIATGANCRADAGDILCTGLGRLIVGTITLGDGDDSADVPGGLLVGGPGADTLRGRGDTYTHVRFDGGPGADVMSTEGGPGHVIYEGRPRGVDVTLDGVANDGEAGEGDNAGAGVANVLGSDHADLLDARGVSARLVGNGGDDRLIGSPGPDSLEDGPGNDTALGGDGNDVFRHHAGGDLYRGGDGARDEIYYYGTDSITVTLDDRPGDGVPGEGDDVGSDVEAVFTGDGDDRVVGSDGPNIVSTSYGSDAIDGRGGDDILLGGSDWPEFATSPVTTNTVTGGPGADRFVLHGPSDVIRADDGEADSIECAEAPVLVGLSADAIDTAPGCAPHPQMVSPRPGRGAARVDRRGRAVVRVACPKRSDIACAGSMRLMRGSKADARGRFAIPAGRSARVSLRLSSRALRLVRRGRRVRGWVHFTTRRDVPAVSATQQNGALTFKRR